MKNLFAIMVVMIATGFVAASADENYFADKPVPVALLSTGYHVTAKPEVRVSLADVAATSVAKVEEEAHSKDQQQSKAPVTGFIAW